MSCDNYPSKKDVEDFALNTRVINEFTTESGKLTTSAASDGKQKITLAEIWRLANESNITSEFLYQHTWRPWISGSSSATGDIYAYKWESGHVTILKATVPAILGDKPDFSAFETLLVPSPMDFGAWGDGVTDDTVAIRSAVKYAQIINLSRTYLVNTFDLAGGTVAVEIDSNTVISGGGVITSSSTAVINSVFAVSSSTDVAKIEIRDISFTGAARWRAITVPDDATIGSLKLSNISTDAQSIIIGGDITSLSVNDCIMGSIVSESSAVSPQLSINLVNFSGACNVTNNTVITGTEAINGAFILHGLNQGLISGNKHFNLGKAATEGFDIDRVGRHVIITDNHCVYSGFEYKTGTNYDENFNAIFANNSSYECVGGAAFSFRSPCVVSNCVAHNPSGKGFYCVSIADEFADNYAISMSNCRSIYAGNPLFGNGFDLGFSNTTIRDCDVIIDAKYKSENPEAKIPASTVRVMSSDIENLKILGGILGDCAENHIIIRPLITENRNISISEVTFGNTDDSFIDAMSVVGMSINNCATTQSSSVDRPIRLSTCRSVSINSTDTRMTPAFVTGGENGITINGSLVVNAGVGNSPPNIPDAGLFVTALNLDDNTMWVKVSPVDTPSSQWKKI